MDSGSTTCSVLLTTLNNVGSTTLFKPVFSNLQQLVIFTRVDPGQADEQRQRQIPVPNQPGRRPYHALARENGEAFNAFLTRGLPVVTHQLERTMELMNQLIQRQLDN